MPSFNEKVVLVTGSSSGIGAATAVHFAGLGCRGLTISGRNQTNLDAVKADCVKNGLKEDQVLVVNADVTKEEDRQKIFDSIKTKFGRLDVLVNNAGVSPRKQVAVLDGTMENFDSIFDTNVKAVVRITQLCLPLLIEAKGAIVNLSSFAAVRPVSYCTFYSMSKSAIDQFTKCLAMELADKQVRVNAVNPAVIETPLFARGGLNDKEVEEFYARMRQVHALGRIGQPVEVARAIAFLASDDASFTTGETLLVDGGRAAMIQK